MSLPQSYLDDRTWADLVAEMRALIPGLAPDWTDHNASDPGITLVELFAWLTEMLIYRVNRIPREHRAAFLRLLNGPDWRPGPDLDEEIRAAVLDLRRRHRAVTAADYEALALEAAAGVARTRCVPRRNLGARTEGERAATAPAWVSVIIVPERKTKPGEEEDLTELPVPSAALLAAVREYLEPRRLLTVRQAVVPPLYVPVRPEVVLARQAGASVAELKGRVASALQRFLDPLRGGPDGEGWPFGRDLYLSELFQLLEAVPGVDYVIDVALPGNEAAGLWHESGDPVGLGLGAHQLPRARVDPGRLVVGDVFVPIRLKVRVRSADDDAGVRRQVKAAVRRLFHPLEGRGPAGLEWETGVPEIRAALEAAGAATAGDEDVEIGGPPERVFDEDGVRRVRLAAGELADLRVEVEVL